MRVKGTGEVKDKENPVCLMQINEKRTRNIMSLMTHSLHQNAPFTFGFGKGLLAQTSYKWTGSLPGNFTCPPVIGMN
jgi:hypothetical protein